MKKLLFILTIIISLTLIGNIGQSEEESTFKAVTKDGEIATIGQIEIAEIYPTSRVWTLNLIDFYLERHKETIEKQKDYIKQLTEIRAKVEEEAKKIKLKTKDSKI